MSNLQLFDNENVEIMKPSAVIQMSGVLNLAQMKAYNILLLNAGDKISEDVTHEIDEIDLKKQIGYAGKDHTVFRKSLEGMMTKILRYNLFKKDNLQKWDTVDWESVTAFSSIGSHFDERTQRRKIEYTYSKPLRDRLKKPQLFAILKIFIQQHINSKHVMALWQFATDCLTEGSTGDLPLNNLRQFFGLKESRYKLFNDFKRYVLVPATEGVNELPVDFTIALRQPVKNGKKVVAIGWDITPKNTQETLSLQDNINPELEELIPKLEEMGVAEPRKIIEDNDFQTDFIRYTIARAKKSRKEGFSLGKTVGVALRKKWYLEDWKAKTKKEAKERQKKQESIFSQEAENEKEQYQEAWRKEIIATIQGVFDSCSEQEAHQLITDIESGLSQWEQNLCQKPGKDKLQTLTGRSLYLSTAQQLHRKGYQMPALTFEEWRREKEDMGT